MDFEDVVERILSLRGDLTRDEVLRLIREKQASAEGFFTDAAAARMVASDLAVEIPMEPVHLGMEIKKLISGLNDVTVTGRVILVYPPRTFTRSDMTEGRVARLLIADSSGELTVVLWDAKISVVENGKIKEGQIARFSHGYVRNGFDGKLELHMGPQGDIQISPSDIRESTYPPLSRFLKKIGEITKKDKNVNVICIIQHAYPTSTFKRKDGTDGKVRRLLIQDETGQIAAVFWNQKADELGDVNTEGYLQLMNTRVKERLDGQLELHVENKTQVRILSEKPTYLVPSPTPSRRSL